jgi:hypothetical protein
MSTIGQSELDRLLGRLKRKWAEQVVGSPEAREARAALQLHRRKVHRLEDWKAEQFPNKLEKDETISEDLINELEMEQIGLEAALHMVMPRV